MSLAALEARVETRLRNLESAQSQYDHLIISADRSVGLLITELRQFKQKTNNRFDELEARFDYQSKRLCAIEEKQLEHDARFDRIESDVSELKADVSELKADTSEIKRLLTTFIAGKD